MTVYRQSAHNFGWNVKELDDGLFVNVNPIHYESCYSRIFHNKKDQFRTNTSNDPVLCACPVFDLARICDAANNLVK